MKNEKKKKVKKEVLVETTGTEITPVVEVKKIGKLALDFNSDGLNAIAAKINEIIDEL